LKEVVEFLDDKCRLGWEVSYKLPIMKLERDRRRDGKRRIKMEERMHHNPFKQKP